MAYMNQVKKALIKAELQKVVPAKWKFSLAVRNHSTIIMTIKSAPVDLLAEYKLAGKQDGYLQVNEFWLEKAFDGETLEIFKKIVAALNINNHDNSDLMSDYHDVGYYVNITVGDYNTPFQVKA